MKRRKFLSVVLMLLAAACLLFAVSFAGCGDKETGIEQGGTEQGGSTPGGEDDTAGTNPDDGSNIEVTSISLNKTSLTLEIDESETLTATILPSDATYKSVIWTSSNRSVASVVNGKVTAKSEGTTTITAEAHNGMTASCTVIVKAATPEIIKITSVSLDKTSLNLEIGESETLTATVLPSNATDKSVTWASSDQSVATVVNGKVTAIESGTATITATTNNGKTAICTVIVKAAAPETVEVTSVSLDKTSLTLEVGESSTLTVTVLPNNATDKSVTWTSSDQSVATVVGGKVTAVGSGSATITATTSNGKTAICTVIVNEPAPEIIEVTSVSLNKTSLTLEVGESETLTATVLPGNATDKSVTWTSSEQSVATVVSGKVTAIESGTATITATTSNGKTASCTVTVNEPAPEIIEVTSVSLDKTSLTLEVGESETLTATVLPSNATDKSVTWISSNAAVATVANGKITAVGIGSATITATTSNGKSAVCTVTVVAPYADFSFTLSGNGYAITGYSGADTEVAVPAEYMGKAVTIIADRAFYDCSFITKITLPDTIKEIGSSAFGYCTSLQTIDIPACTRILDGAFIGCTSLKEITLPDGLISIGSNLFTNCNSLNKVTILSGSVASDTFADCTNLKEIVIGDNVTSIARYAFEDCTSLQYLTLPRVEENASFNEYYFNIKNSVYTLSGTGAGNLYPAEVKSYNVGGHIFGIPVTGTDWYYNYDTVTQDGVTYQYSGKPVTVTSWEDMYEVTVGVSWRRPEEWKAEVYLAGDSSLEKLTITDQLISVYDEVFDGCGCEIDISEKFPVETISVVGEAELYLDEFSLDDYVLRVKHTDGWIEDLPLAEHLTEEEKGQLRQAGTHTFNMSYGGQSCEWSIKLDLHTFDDAVLEDITVIADGTAKYLQVTGIPEDTEVIWENNGQTEVGEYTVTATLKKPYYQEKTLTAHLYIRRAQYNITYVLGVEEAENTNPPAYNFGAGLTLSSPASDAWEFLGWYADEEFNKKVTAISADDYGDKTLYAKWQSIFEYSNGEITGFTDSAQKLYNDGQIKSIGIPSEIAGQKITGIGERAFEDCSSLTSVTIGSGVTSIGSYAFSDCSGLESINIPDSVTSIGSYAFSGCSSLTSITIPDGVTSIGGRAFSGCSSLTSITIPDGVTSIGEWAFSGCGSLTSITIPDSVTSIGEDAFYNCSNLEGVYITDIAAWCAIDFGGSYVNPLYYAHNLYLNGELVTELVIPEGVTSIGNAAFYNCSRLASITIPDGVTSIGEDAFYNCSSLESITIPDDVTSIGDYAFRGCSSLTSITIPEGVTSIGDYAFDGCSSLTSVTIGDGVTSIGNAAFYNCSSLTSVTIGDGVTSIGEDAFYGCSSLESITIGDGVTSIGEDAFHDCSNLEGVYITDIAAWCAIDFGGSYVNPLYYAHNLYLNGELVTELVIPEGVTSIGERAFYNCSSLTSVTIGNSVTSIGDYAFYNCSRLTSIIIGDGVTSIGDRAFEYCSSITSITIPDSVTSIGEDAFYNCSNLEGVYITDIAAWCAIDFGGSYVNPLYYAHNLYLNGELVTNLVIPEGVTSIGERAFYNYSSLTSVTIGDGVTSIGEYAFYYCSSLTSITIPDSVTSIGERAFYGCSSLESITIGDGVTSIGDYAFYDCDSLACVTIGKGVTSIGNNAFYNCSSLTNITIPDSVTSIGEDAFHGCSSLESITLPFVGAQKGGTSNTYFGYIFGASSYSYNANYVPKSLKVVSITGGEIADYAFYNCRNLTSITISDSVTSIGYFAFYGCSSLESITISDGVTSIGERAFYGCTSLEGVYITDIAAWCAIDFGLNYANPLCYAHYLYLNGERVTNLVIPEGVTSIGYSAFGHCYSLTSVTIGNGVKSIGYSAFGHCYSLESIIIGDGVTSIGYHAFWYCSSLTSITIPDSVTSIGDSAFEYCSNLASVIFENPNDWWYSSSSTATSGTSISRKSLSNPSTAAEYLKSTYRDYYWKRG